MRRGSTRSVGDRVGNGLYRATLSKTADDHKFQEVDISLTNGEKQTEIEHFHPYGFSSRVMPPAGKQKAEAIVAFLGGSRSHGVVIVAGDRRFRMQSLKEGEVALHDDQGQSVYLTRDGVKVESPKEVLIKAPTIILEGDVKLGGRDASRPVSAQGTVDTAGDADVSNPLTKVWGL